MDGASQELTDNVMLYLTAADWENVMNHYRESITYRVAKRMIDEAFPE